MAVWGDARECALCRRGGNSGDVRLIFFVNRFFWTGLFKEPVEKYLARTKRITASRTCSTEMFLGSIWMKDVIAKTLVVVCTVTNHELLQITNCSGPISAFGPVLRNGLNDSLKRSDPNEPSKITYSLFHEQNTRLYLVSNGQSPVYHLNTLVK